MAAPYTPVKFPEPASKKTFKFRKDREATYTMTRAVYEELYRRGCVDVTPVPAMNLQNEVHVIFRRDAFRGITATQYNFMRPALTLASRFITENEYMEFWAHLCTAGLVKDNQRELHFSESETGQVLES